MTWIHVLKRSYRSLFIQVSIWQEWGGHNRQIVCICIWSIIDFSPVVNIYFSFIFLFKWLIGRSSCDNTVAARYCKPHALHLLIRYVHRIFTCLVNSVTSSLNDSDEQTSPGPPGSLGVQVANSHFSKINANNGNNGWLKEEKWNCLILNSIIMIKHQERNRSVFRVSFIFSFFFLLCFKQFEDFWYLRISIYIRVIIIMIEEKKNQ